MTSEERLDRLVGSSTIESHTKQWQEDYQRVKKELKAMQLIRDKGISIRYAGAIVFLEHTYEITDEEESLVREVITNGE